MSSSDSSTESLRYECGVNTSDDAEELDQTQCKPKGRPKGGTQRDYNAFCSFKDQETAKKFMQDNFKATQLNTVNNAIWFKCRDCTLRF